MDRVVGSGAKWLDPQPATETGSPVLLAENPYINLGKHTGLVWANLKVERLNCLLAHVRKLGRDSKTLMPVAAKLTRDQYHELLVGFSSSKCPTKQSWPWCQ
jgi:hypothetical protein